MNDIPVEPSKARNPDLLYFTSASTLRTDGNTANPIVIYQSGPLYDAKGVRILFKAVIQKRLVKCVSEDVISDANGMTVKDTGCVIITFDGETIYTLDALEDITKQL